LHGEPEPIGTIATTKDSTCATCYYLTTIPDGDCATFKDAAEAVRRDLAEEIDPGAYSDSEPRGLAVLVMATKHAPWAQAVSDTAIRLRIRTTCDAERMPPRFSLL